MWLGEGSPRDDKVLDDATAVEMMRQPAVAEEKVDGANLGISVDARGGLQARNRGSFLAPGGHPQFKHLFRWLAVREEALRDALGANLILFGEWCYARHTVLYDRLPDWFIAFDVYEVATRRFWSRARRESLVRRLGLASVPLLGEGVFDRSRIEGLLGTSRFADAPMEGIYLRWEDGGFLTERAKVVRRTWVQPDEEHWSRRTMEPNRLGERHS
jgi:ATP-dependent RNA circularization protein (DNA/RNA ligase family)